jgi:hypothetical protein
MLYSGKADLTALASPRNLPLYPNVGNGYLGGILGCFREDNGGEGPTATAGVLHVGGVFNGENTSSKRAEVPGIFSLYPLAANGKDVAFGGSALDLASGVFINRTLVPGCGVGAAIEQRWYAHRSLRSLLVYEVELFQQEGTGASTGASAAAGGCAVLFGGCNADPSSSSSMETTIVSKTPEGVVSSLSVTLERETANTSVATVARVFQEPEATLQLGPAAPALRFIAALTTSLPEEGASAPAAAAAADDDPPAAADPLAAATALFESARANASALRPLHAAAWAVLHATRIELAGAEGDETAAAVATAVNSSLFYLLSAARADWPFSTSPGGLANNACM